MEPMPLLLLLSSGSKDLSLTQYRLSTTVSNTQMHSTTWCAAYGVSVAARHVSSECFHTLASSTHINPGLTQLRRHEDLWRSVDPRHGKLAADLLSMMSKKIRPVELQDVLLR